MIDENTGCTWRFAIVNGEKVDISVAERAQHGVCPLCGGELVAKKGDVRVAHWSHVRGRNCDAWYESKGEWHKWWQNRFEESLQEVPIKSRNENEERHIADVLTTDRWVIEFQYSHLSKENIFIREKFYGDMFWVVNGTRLSRDKSKGEVLLGINNFRVSATGMRYFVLESDNINLQWRCASKLVFFDFYGTFNEPSVGTDLLCLLPEAVYSSRVMVRVGQKEFIEKIRSGNIKGFVEKLEACGSEYKEIRRPEEEEKERRLKEAQAEVARLRKENEERLLKSREDARRRELENPTLYAITCGWVEAFLLVNRGFNEFQGSWDLSKLPQHGSIAIHLTNRYTKKQYWDDRNLQKQMGVRRYMPEYEKLQKSAGMIIGKFEYVALYDPKKQEWKLEVLAVDSLKDFDEHDRVLYNVSDGKDVWLLSDELKLAVNDRTYKQVDNPNCPICGKKMVQRRRKSDGGPFWGCSQFWDSKCNGALPCDDEGRLVLTNVYWCSLMD